MLSQNQRKRQFIEWLLKRHQHANPAVTYLLNFLMTQPHIIDQVVFSEHVKYAPRGLYISYQSNTKVPFIYYKDQLSYTQCEQAFHDLRLNMQFEKKTYYIELNIPDMYQQLFQWDIFVDNPFLPEDQELIQSTERHLNQLSIEATIKQLKRRMDLALENHHFEEVSHCVNQIEQLRGELDAI